MKKSEKQMILILIIVAIIIIAVLVKVRNGRVAEGEVNSGNTGTNIQTSNVSNKGTSGTNSGEEYVEVLEDGTKLNVSEKLSEIKKVGNYEISNIQITEKDGQCFLIASVKNTSSSKMEDKFAKVVFLDKEGNQITTTDVIIQGAEAGEAVQIKASLTTDFSNAYDFTMTINE